jgi:glyoxylase-like metal-dependent hydrolase (beta-lactamase superfamily II)
MNIERFTTSINSNNTYLAYCPGAKVGIIVDPSYEIQPVLDRIAELGLDIRLIFNTHRHCDHIAGNAAFKFATKAEIVIHELDAGGLTDPNLNLSSMVPPVVQSPPANRIVSDGEKIVMETKLGPLEFEVWHTPGHSPGHCCLKFHRGIFTGDLLFEGTIGRTDFPGCDPSDMKKSLTRLWNNIPDSYEIFPGHNEITTMEKEKKDNYLFAHMAISG